MWAAIQAALSAIAALPRIIDEVRDVAGQIADLIRHIKDQNTLKKIDLELQEIKRSGNTSALEKRFRDGRW